MLFSKLQRFSTDVILGLSFENGKIFVLAIGFSMSSTNNCLEELTSVVACLI